MTTMTDAQRRAAEFRYSERPRWIVTCNFTELHMNIH